MPIVAVAAAMLTVSGCTRKDNTPDDSNDGSVAWPETPVITLVEGQPGGTFRLGISEPTAIDPYNAQESEGMVVTQNVFTGLVQVEPDGSIIPGVAESWEPDATCAEWTFTLQSGTTFHNGEPVTSAAFKRGWERAAVRSAASEVAYHMNSIEGFVALQDGSATTFSGVDASDPELLTVTLSEPDCEFYLRTVHPVFSPVPEVAGAADNAAYNDQPIGNGPFMMDGPWEHNSGIRLVRFDDYSVGPAAYLDAVELTITAGGSQDEYDGFNNGTFDWARPPTPLLSQARADNEADGNWIRRNTNGINYLLPMVTEAPLDSAEARKAISMAIDRDAIIAGIFQGALTPATSIVPPAFPDAYQPGVCDACHFDLEAAKALAEEAGLTPGTEINFQFNTGGGHEEWTAAVKQQLETNLGLVVNYTGVPFVDMLNNQQQVGASGIYRLAWGADYPTPGNFLAPLLSTAAIGAGPDEPVVGDNRGRYSNSQFDELLRRAKGTTDEAERISLYQEAERIAIGEDLALIPMWNRTVNRLVDAQEFTNLRMDFFEYPDLSVICLKVPG